jgi:energy-coupling factor transport system permease protein
MDQLPSRIHQIFLAQQARGAPVDAGVIARTRALFSILSPLVLSSIVESIERGTALELRGFLLRSEVAPRSDARQFQANWLTVLLLVVSFAILAYSVVQWLIK